MFWGHPHFYMYGSNFGFLPPLLNILFIVLGITLIVSLFTHKNDNGEKHDEEIVEEDTAIEILKKRYAKGELTKREFEQMKKDVS